MKKRLPSGFEYEVERLPPDLEEARQGYLRTVRGIRERIESWLAEPPSKRARRRLAVSHDEANVITRALKIAESSAELRQQLEDLARRDLALRRLYKESGAADVIKALGWAPRKKGRKLRHSPEEVVTDYFILLGQSALQGMNQMPPENPVGAWAQPRQQDTASAIRTLAQLHGFKSPAACRQFLLRARRSLRAKYPTQGFGSFRTDYPLPHPNDLDTD